MKNHCDKHKNYIPSCKKCNAQKVKANKIKEEKNNSKDISKKEKQVIFHEKEIELLSKIRKNTEICTKDFESISIGAKMFVFIHLFYQAMDEQGYDFVNQINVNWGTRDIYLIFKKRKSE